MYMGGGGRKRTPRMSISSQQSLQMLEKMRSVQFSPQLGSITESEAGKGLTHKAVQQQKELEKDVKRERTERELSETRVLELESIISEERESQKVNVMG